MKLKEFIMQGVTPRTHSSAMREMLQAPGISRVIIGTAFATQGGVDEIGDVLADLSSVTQVYAGIRNGVTTRQGLERLLSLGVDLKTVDTGTMVPIYHPKLLYVRSAEAVSILSGSANLTLGGLHNNIEGSLLLHVEPEDTDALETLAALEAVFDGLEEAHPQNVRAITDTTQIAYLHGLGLLVDEDTSPPARTWTTSAAASKDETPRMKMALSPKRRTRKKPGLSVGTSPSGGQVVDGNVAGTDFEVVWESGPLGRRDLGIPTAANTKRTGSINLDKGAFGKTIDQRHYFREEVFSALDWPTVSQAVDRAPAVFDLIVKGVRCGTHILTVRHTTSTTSKSYDQDNAMTRISWGTAASFVRKEELKDSILTLSRDRNDHKRFVLDVA